MKLVKIFLVWCLMISPCYAQNVVTVSDPSRPIIVSPNTKQFTINLSAIPSTGYGWRLKSYDAKLLTPISQVFQVLSNNPGASGVETFTFQVTPINVKTVTQLTFIYVRPWNMAIGKTAIFNVIW